MEKESILELEQLIQLTQKFMHYTNSLLEGGTITQKQYDQMAEKKLRFLEDVQQTIKA
ncbi:MAG: hypothetical protein GX962_14550 [Epulopiscium sp.]|nr:hypothetical protein [Candidatus Epulonipiscium sp.]